MSRADTDPQPAVPGPAEAGRQPVVPGPASGESRSSAPGSGLRDPRPAASGSGEGDARPAASGLGDPGRAASGLGEDPRSVASDAGVGDGTAAGLAAGDGGPVEPGAARRAPWRGWEPIIRVAGVVIAILASFVSGVFELLLSTLRAGDVTAVWHGDAIGSGGGPLIGLSVVLAAVLNYGIAWFAVSTTGRKWALGPPWALWTLMMLFAAGVRTSEGDYLLSGTNWVALVMILVGSLSYAVYSYRMILKRVPR
jgi:hypothetical protein